MSHSLPGRGICWRARLTGRKSSTDDYHLIAAAAGWRSANRDAHCRAAPSAITYWAHFKAAVSSNKSWMLQCVLTSDQSVHSSVRSRSKSIAQAWENGLTRFKWKGANVVTITLKKTHNGTQQKQWHNRLRRETRGFGIGFPFDGERKQRRDGGRGGTEGRKCWWHTAQINDITVQSSTESRSKWGHSGQDLLYWQQHVVSLPGICALMHRQALSQHGRCLDSTFKSHDLSEGCRGADVFPIQLKFTLH